MLKKNDSIMGVVTMICVVFLKVVATKGWPKVSGMFSSQARTQAAKLEMIEGLCDENGDGMVK